MENGLAINISKVGFIKTTHSDYCFPLKARPFTECLITGDKIGPTVCLQRKSPQRLVLEGGVGGLLAS